MGKLPLCDVREVLSADPSAHAFVESPGRRPAGDLFSPLSIAAAANAKLLLAFINNTAARIVEHTSPI